MDSFPSPNSLIRKTKTALKHMLLETENGAKKNYKRNIRNIWQGYLQAIDASKDKKTSRLCI